MLSRSISRSFACAVFLSTLPLHAFASGGNEVGNGGNVVTCKDHVELLDLYEAHVLRGMSIDPALRGADPFQIAKERLDLLSKADPKSVALYENGLKNIRSDLSLEKEISLQPLDDSQHQFVPKDAGCHVERIAVLRKKPLPGEKRVLIDETIWNRMLPVQQAALLLHETIYERLAFLGEADSSKARYLVSYMMSSKIRTDSTEEYWKLIRVLRLPIYR